GLRRSSHSRLEIGRSIWDPARSTTMNTVAAQLVELLGLARQPVAVLFRDSAPAGVDRIETAAPSGCTYWKYAAQGRTFYTVASDHYGCPIGSYTHGIDLPEEQQRELQG